MATPGSPKASPLALASVLSAIAGAPASPYFFWLWTGPNVNPHMPWLRHTYYTDYPYYPYLHALTLLLGGAGLTVGIISIRRGSPQKALALAGIVVSTLEVLALLYIYMVAVFILGAQWW